MNLIQEIYASDEFQKLRRERPESASLLLDHYRTEWAKFLTHINSYRDYQKAVTYSNKMAGSWGDGKIAGSIPAVIVAWLEERARLRGEELTNKELYRWLKKHKEWATIEKH